MGALEVGVRGHFGSGERADDGLRVQVGDVPGLLARIIGELHVHEARLAGGDGLADHLLDFRRGGRVIAVAAERLDHALVVGVVAQRQRRRVAVVAEILEIAAVDAAVVEHDEGDRQIVAAGDLDFHAVKAEAGITADVQDRIE